MNQETTVGAAWYDNALVELRQRFFYQHPENEAEAIAKHYTANAISALKLLQMIDLKKNQDFVEPVAMNESLDFLMDRIVQQIKADHILDFGTPIFQRPNFAA